MTKIPDSANVPVLETVTPETTVPNGETPLRCPYCDRPFRTEHVRALHLGENHSETWTHDERTAYEEAEDSESDDLFVFHLKVIAALVGLYAVVVLMYMVVL